MNHQNRVKSLIEIWAYANKINEEITHFPLPLPTFVKEMSSASDSSISSAKSQNNNNLKFNFSPLTYNFPLTQSFMNQTRESELLNTLKKSIAECKVNISNNRMPHYNLSEMFVDRKDSTISSDNTHKLFKIDYISLYNKALSKTPRFINSKGKISQRKQPIQPIEFNSLRKSFKKEGTICSSNNRIHEIYLVNLIFTLYYIEVKNRKMK